jgi:mannose-1-phosphate guanylyltransferase/mannose-1-phosphate guanylyltransferase/mannose-6-phosphate isomerase
MTDLPKIHPVILSGGSGTRLWPMSRESYPKQLLPLTADRTLLQETAARVGNPARFAAPVVVCNESHRFIVAEQLRELAIRPRCIVLEPFGRNTAPAAAIAALTLAQEDPDALLLLLPSDHVIADVVAFQAAVSIAASAARDGALVTFGIKPDKPETGYGYIRRGAPLDGRSGCFSVGAFVEKPDLATARRYLEAGDYDWNSGMFLFSARTYLDELERLEPETVARCRESVDGAVRDLDFVRLSAEPFKAAPSRSIDYAVMEHTERAAVVPAEFGWNDVGSWSALWDIGRKDEAGNIAIGDVLALESTDSYLRSEGKLVAALGVDGLVVVATDDAVLITPKARAQDVRLLVDALKRRNRPEPTLHPRVYRPWGYYQTLHDGSRFQVKRITVNIGACLSLQLHHHRAEHWVVVNGAARVTRGSDVFMLNENESAYIPPNTVHRLENPGKVPLNLIEIQSGSYLGEDDIVRIEDNYGRN